MLPAAAVLALGFVILVWGFQAVWIGDASVLDFKNDSPRMCPPNVFELLGIDPEAVVQAVIAVVVGGAAVCFAVADLRYHRRADL